MTIPHCLADHGRTDWVIAIAPTAPLPEQNAARELAAHLHRITRARFPIQPPGRRRGLCLAVGPAAALAVGLPRRALAGLGDDGILIRSVGPHLVLSGQPGAPRGTLYAVYEFLDRVLGCRWWTPHAATLPRRTRLEIPRQDYRYRPPFEYRETLYLTSWNTRWSVRNRTNGRWEEKHGGVPASWGGHHIYKGFVHTFAALVPPKRFFQLHPDWFALVDGKRTPEQLCLTHPGVREHVTNTALGWLRQTPRANLISISQNDNHIHCQCRGCSARDAREGSPAGSLLHFVNRVAAAIEKEFPRVAVDTLAYLHTRRPPRHARPRRNVIVRLCSFECDFLHSLAHRNNAAFRRDIAGWARICKRLYVWDYVTNFAHFVMPHPNWFTLGDNIRFFRDHHVRGLFEQGNHQSPGGEMGYLRAWVLARLMWDPDRDTRALVREFLAGYYGPAGAHIEACLEVIHRRALAVPYYAGSKAIRDCLKKRGYPQARAGCYLDLNAVPEAPFLSPGVVLQALRHMEDARRAVAGDRRLIARVALAALPIRYVCLLRWKKLRAHARRSGRVWPFPPSRRAACRQFLRVARANGITRLGEHWTKRDLAWLSSVCGLACHTMKK